MLAGLRLTTNAQALREKQRRGPKRARAQRFDAECKEAQSTTSRIGGSIMKLVALVVVASISMLTGGCVTYGKVPIGKQPAPVVTKY